MIEQSHEEQLFQRYLLGDLGEEERERLQQRYFTDASLFSRLLHVEADLIDAYQRGELTVDERKRFEERFGNTRGIDQRLKFASVLGRTADEHAMNTPDGMAGREFRPSLVNAPSSGFPWLSSISPSFGSRLVRASLVAIAAVIVVTAVLVAANRWLRDAQPGRELAGSQTDSPPGQPTPRLNTRVTPGTTEQKSVVPPAVTEPDESRKPTAPKTQLASVTVVLHEVTRESGRSNQVFLSPATRSLQTQLVLPSELQTGNYSRYQAVVQTVSGAEVIRRDGLKISRSSNRAFVMVSIPVELLTTRDYVVLLTGLRSDGTPQYLRGYSFSVTRN